MFHFAVLGAGHIATKMSLAAAGLPEICRYAAASRNLEKAEAFAKEWGYEKAYGSYEEMLDDPQVDLVYVATPHSHHYRCAKLCLEHGKNVLVEKAFTANAAQAKELCRLAQEKGLLLAEALWTRYMPSRKLIDDLLESGVIGEPLSLTANLGYSLPDRARLHDPALAGGALLDLGVYPINFAMMVFKENITKVDSSAILTDRGVDLMNSMTLTFGESRMAVLHSNMHATTDRIGGIFGTKGYMEVENINSCQCVRVYDKTYQLLGTYPVTYMVNGYEYELLACKRAIEEGRYECEEMPHAETIRVMELLDSLRAAWGVKFPDEVEAL